VNTRRQLSLYVPSTEGALLEAVRQVLDPVQAGLIPAHVTLCREDEIGQVSATEIELRLRRSAAQPIRLGFGRPINFEGYGVLLPCVSGEQAFHQLRTEVLGATARRHAPHITLAHPRNPPPAKGGLADAMGLAENMSFTFAAIASIEQIGAALPWRVLREFTLPWR
jgi:2'-5' RNA ligase